MDPLWFTPPAGMRHVVLPNFRSTDRGELPRPWAWSLSAGGAPSPVYLTLPRGVHVGRAPRGRILPCGATSICPARACNLSACKLEGRCFRPGAPAEVGRCEIAQNSPAQSCA